MCRTAHSLKVNDVAALSAAFALMDLRASIGSMPS
jgi:hypothetical protein